MLLLVSLITATGLVLPDNMKFVKQLGKGRTAIVDQVKMNGKSLMALKYPVEKKWGLERMVNEIRILKHIGKHPYIVSVRSTPELAVKDEEDVTVPTILMENCKSIYTADHKDLTITKVLAKQILTAVKDIHKLEIVHHDIKIDNILLCREDFKLADFGESSFTEGSVERREAMLEQDLGDLGVALWTYSGAKRTIRTLKDVRALIKKEFDRNVLEKLIFEEFCILLESYFETAEIALRHPFVNE